MMKYTEAELEIVAFDAEDVITTSLSDSNEAQENFPIYNKDYFTS